MLVNILFLKASNFYFPVLSIFIILTKKKNWCPLRIWHVNAGRKKSKLKRSFSGFISAYELTWIVGGTYISMPTTYHNKFEQVTKKINFCHHIFKGSNLTIVFNRFHNFFRCHCSHSKQHGWRPSLPLTSGFWMVRFLLRSMQIWKNLWSFLYGPWQIHNCCCQDRLPTYRILFNFVQLPKAFIVN